MSNEGRMTRPNRGRTEEKCHYLKSWPEHFSQVLSGAKTFEVRVNDREFSVGDAVVLEEWDVTMRKYTGRRGFFTISYITDLAQAEADGYVVFAIQPGTPRQRRRLARAADRGTP